MKTENGERIQQFKSSFIDPITTSFCKLYPVNSERLEGSKEAAETVTRYVVQSLAAKFPTQWLSGPRKTPSKNQNGGLVEELEGWGLQLTFSQKMRLRPLQNCTDLLAHYWLRSVRESAHLALEAWLNERYPLLLVDQILTPIEMLDLQCEGLRAVTLLLAPKDQERQIGRHQGAREFLLHDLEHAHKFFMDSEMREGQRTFFNFLRKNLEKFALWTGDSQFRGELDYAMADMNSHPLHLEKYMHAIVLNAHLRRLGLKPSDPLPPAERLFLDNFWRSM